MANPRISSILLFSCFLFLFLSPGFGAEVTGTVEHAASLPTEKKEMTIGKWRKMMVQLEEDYHGPRPSHPVPSHNPVSPPAKP